MIKYLKRRGVLLTFLCVIFLISIIIGVIIYFKSSNETKKYICDQLLNFKENLLNSKVNNIFKHLIIISSIVLLTFTILGYFSGIIYLFYEGISLGFTISVLLANYALKGFIFGLLYNIVFKLIYLILYILLLLKLFDLIKIIVNKIILKNSYNIKSNIRKIFFAIILLILIIIINDIIIYFLTNFLLKLIINVL